MAQNTLMFFIGNVLGLAGGAIFEGISMAYDLSTSIPLQLMFH